MLRIATPQGARFEFLKREGLIAPDEISSIEDAVPEDFTRLNNRELGAVHSRYAVRYSHAIYVHSKWVSDLVIAKRNLHLAEAKFSVRHKGDYKTKYELEAAMESAAGINALRGFISTLEAQVAVLEGIAKGYDVLTKAASREISRRQSETAPRD